VRQIAVKFLCHAGAVMLGGMIASSMIASAIDALQQITGWQRTVDGVVLIGPRMLNFRLPTN